MFTLQHPFNKWPDILVALQGNLLPKRFVGSDLFITELFPPFGIFCLIEQALQDLLLNLPGVGPELIDPGYPPLKIPSYEAV